jgi:hypothetical protein
VPVLDRVDPGAQRGLDSAGPARVGSRAQPEPVRLIHARPQFLLGQLLGSRDRSGGEHPARHADDPAGRDDGRPRQLPLPDQVADLDRDPVARAEVPQRRHPRADRPARLARGGDRPLRRRRSSEPPRPFGSRVLLQVSVRVDQPGNHAGRVDHQRAIGHAKPVRTGIDVGHPPVRDEQHAISLGRAKLIVQRPEPDHQRLAHRLRT